MRTVIGWDVGGANVKVVSVREVKGGRAVVTAVRRQAFALWRDPGRLPAVLAAMLRALGPQDSEAAMAVTMTAELADCFQTKREGVAAVLEAFSTAFPDVDLQVYGVDGRFRSSQAAGAEPEKVAAANWMASATLVAREFPDALMLDVGSTTTDIVPIDGGRVVARGRSDTERLSDGELVYTGAQRTPICAILPAVELRAGPSRLAAEYFAIAADAHRWRGWLSEEAYTCETPDGRGRSRVEAGARLARMVCSDLEQLDDEDITRIADQVTEGQVSQIASGIAQVLEARGRGKPDVAVLAGEGTFLARGAVQRAGLAVEVLSDKLGARVAEVAPAAAVAELLLELGG